MPPADAASHLFAADYQSTERDVHHILFGGADGLFEQPATLRRPTQTKRRLDGRVVETHDPALLQLYDLKQDIGKQHNLASQMPEKVTQLHNLLLERLRRTEARFHTKNADYDPSKPETGTCRM